MAYIKELNVITAAKKLVSYVMTITQSSPKQFRFSLVGKMQGYVLDIDENLYRANEVYVAGPNLCRSGTISAEILQHPSIDL